MDETSPIETSSAATLKTLFERMEELIRVRGGETEEWVAVAGMFAAIVKHAETERAQIAAQNEQLNARIEALFDDNASLHGTLEALLRHIDERVGAVYVRIGELNTLTEGRMIEKVDARYATLHNRIDGVDGRIEAHMNRTNAHT